MQSLIIDNFLPYPNIIRQWALTHEFRDARQFSEDPAYSPTYWPGVRTTHVVDLDVDYTNVVLGRISSIIQSFHPSPDLTIKSYFQLCNKYNGNSWIHQDNDVDYAGILFLTPNPPENSGTILYDPVDIDSWNSLPISEKYTLNEVSQPELYSSLFRPSTVIQNKFNRLVLYSGQEFHKSDQYFGEFPNDSRLTQIFFINAGGSQNHAKY